jgi:hypothetical protein
MPGEPRVAIQGQELAVARKTAFGLKAESTGVAKHRPVTE